MTVHAWTGQRHPVEKSRELQRRVYLAAKRRGTRGFHARSARIVRPDVLWRAWVRRGGGPAAGFGRRRLGSGHGAVPCRPSTPPAGGRCSLARRKGKVVGKPYEGEPHVRFDVAGVETRISVPGATPRPYQLAIHSFPVSIAW